MLVLHDWMMTGKPPLLGPQTSSLPFNQSAIYFYILQPLFFITHESVFSSVYTLVIYYLLLLSGTWWLVRKEKTLRNAVLTALTIFSLHPQFIIQNRFVWNPSFVAPLVLLGFVLFFLYQKKENLKYIAASAAAFTLAASLSYSILPVALAFSILAFYIFKKRGLIFLAAEAVSMFVWNLPTVFFEFRHHFLLTQAMLHRKPMEQIGATFSDKLYNFTTYVISIPNSFVFWLFVGLIIGVTSWFFYKYQQEKQALFFLLSAILFAITIVITFVMPVPLHSHYIFGLLTLLAVTIGLLPWRVACLLIAIALCSWLQPNQILAYFQTPFRTVAQTEACAQTLCRQLHEPVFVSVQAQNHPFHNGPEFRFLFKKAGCNVQAIEENPQAAQTMLVVNDNSQYTHGETAFNELTLFGLSEDAQVISCQSNLSVHVLKRL